MKTSQTALLKKGRKTESTHNVYDCVKHTRYIIFTHTCPIPRIGTWGDEATASVRSRALKLFSHIRHMHHQYTLTWSRRSMICPCGLDIRSLLQCHTRIDCSSTSFRQSKSRHRTYPRCRHASRQTHSG